MFDTIFLLPLRGVLAIAKKISKYVDEEINDETNLQRQLLELRLLYEMDEIGEEEYEEKERQILDKLSKINACDTEEE